jgi:hypothetical protein
MCEHEAEPWGHPLSALQKGLGSRNNRSPLPRSPFLPLTMLSISTFMSNPAKKSPGLYSTAEASAERDRKAYKGDFSTFRTKYPQYDQSATLDILRKTEFGRLKRANEVYVDYMGGCLWPECLVSAHSAILQAGLFGNTHSDSPW